MKNSIIKNQRGQAMTEYIVVLAALMVALFSAEDVMKQMRDAMKGSYEGYSYTLSIAEMPDDTDDTNN